MNTGRWIWVFVVLILFFSLMGCLSMIGERCRVDSDCRSGLICYIPEGAHRGTCRRPCRKDDDCGAGRVCVPGGACFLPAELEDGGLDVVRDDVGSGEDFTSEDSFDLLDGFEFDGECLVVDAGYEIVDGSCQLPGEFPNSFRVTFFNVGEDGTAGSGLDVDGNSLTCAPSGACSSGIDNAMAMLGIIGNASLSDAVNGGSMNMIIEIIGYEEESYNCPFTIEFYKGRLISGEAGCSDQPGCSYGIEIEGSFDLDRCCAVSSIGSVFHGPEGEIYGGGEGYTFYFNALVVGLELSIPVYNSKIEGKLTVQQHRIISIEGVIGGIVKKDDFIGAFEKIPAEQYPAGISKDDVISMFEGMYDSNQIERDFDLDGDTVNESSSIGIIFEAHPTVVESHTLF